MDRYADKGASRGNSLAARLRGRAGSYVLARVLPLLVVAALLFPCPALTDSPSQVFEKTSSGIVVIAVYNDKGKAVGLGSGVVTRPGQVVTNCHVTKGGENYKVRWQNQAYAASLTYSDFDRDLCQLKVPGLKAPAVSIGSVKALKVGTRVYAIGAPQGLELTLSEGIVSALRDLEGSKYIQTTAAISSGSSGGGLFDDQARLVGITTFYLEDGQSLNFALPVDCIAELPSIPDTSEDRNSVTVPAPGFSLQAQVDSLEIGTSDLGVIRKLFGGPEILRGLEMEWYERSTGKNRKIYDAEYPSKGLSFSLFINPSELYSITITTKNVSVRGLRTGAHIESVRKKLSERGRLLTTESQDWWWLDFQKQGLKFGFERDKKFPAKLAKPEIVTRIEIYNSTFEDTRRKTDR